MVNENEAILKSRSDDVKKEKGTIESGWQLCWNQAWLLKNYYWNKTWISILSSLQLEKTVLGGEQFLKHGYSQAIVKDFFVFKIFINIAGGGGGRGAGMPTWSWS